MSGLAEVAADALAGMVSSPIVVIGLRVLLAGLAILWLASAWWVWRDARSRARDPLTPYLAAAAILVMTPVLFLPAVVVYRVLRPGQTVAAGEAVALQLAVLAEESAVTGCRSCGAPVDEEWLACPACGTTLAVRCDACGRPLQMDWRICAWCAADVPWAAEVARQDARPPLAPRPVRIPIRPGGRPVLPAFPAPDRAPGRGPGGTRRQVGGPRPSS